MSKHSLAIGCASAFWGDTPLAVQQLLRAPKLDYIVSDYLSEVTLALLSKKRSKDPTAGYTEDFFTDVIEPHLAEILSKKIKLVSNAGGMNPEALKVKIEAFASSHGLRVKVVAVSGDDLIARKLLPAEIQDYGGKTHSTQGWVSANVYLGAAPIVEALAAGADVVITGRVVDSALVLAPAVHEFGWHWNDYDLLAQASLAGHVIECGTQCTGGNFTDWQSIPHSEDMGFPIAILDANGKFEITKTPGTGGLVTEASIAEQIVYEIGNPAAYELPDVICDFSKVQLARRGTDRVEVVGATGSAPSSKLKALATVFDGWKISAVALMMGGDANEKALSVGRTILKRAEQELKHRGMPAYSETRVEALGSGNESLLRVSAAHPKSDALEILAKEVAPAATSLAPGLTQLVGGRANPTPRVKLIGFPVEKSSLKLPKSESASNVKVDVKGFEPTFPPRSQGKNAVILQDLAFARSGDKGNDVNIGVIARTEQDYATLRRELTIEKVARFFSQEFDDPSRATVQRWELPGIGGLNFLLKNCLGGGGAYSLKSDPQGKAFAQRLLQMRISE